LKLRYCVTDAAFTVHVVHEMSYLLLQVAAEVLAVAQALAKEDAALQQFEDEDVKVRT
jgi:hypothetical protein